MSVNGLTVGELVRRANTELAKHKGKLSISAAGELQFKTVDLISALYYGTNKDRYAAVSNPTTGHIERVRCIQGH